LRFSDIPVPQYRYFPTHLKETRGPKQWARLRILQACERLDIPGKLWPKFPDFQLPRPYSLAFQVKEHPELPPFLPLIETASQWKERCRPVLNRFVNEQARVAHAWFKNELSKGLYVRIKPTRDTTPLDLRYEWTAKRYCLRLPYSELAIAGYTAERIRKSVSVTLKQAGLQGK
jgi:hypothetical protein